MLTFSISRNVKILHLVENLVEIRGIEVYIRCGDEKESGLQILDRQFCRQSKIITNATPNISVTRSVSDDPHVT